jgi:FkbM family methyltransferase
MLDEQNTKNVIKTKTCKHGIFSYPITDVFTGRSMDVMGEACEHEVQFLCSLVGKQDTVIDVGAHIGTHALALAKEASCVIAFEPQPFIYRLLAENVDANGANIRLHQTALGAYSAVAKMPVPDYAQAGNFGGIGLAPDAWNTTLIDFVEVSVEPLDSFGIDDCRLLKIDVEGYEAEVLRGARETIMHCRPIVYIENDRAEKSAALIELLQEMGYALYWHVCPYNNEGQNFFGYPDKLFEPSVFAVNMLCVLPEDKHLPQLATLRRVTSHYDRPVFSEKITDSTPNGWVRVFNGWAGVVRFGGIGDNLIAASAVGALKRAGYKVEVITSSESAWHVFEHNTNIDKLSVKSKMELPQDLREWQKWHAGRGQEFDVFANLHHSCEMNLATFTATTNFWWPRHMRRMICGRSYLEFVHDIAGIGYDFGPLFYATAREKEIAKATKAKIGKRVIAWVISGSRLDKIHPHTPTIIARIIKELGVPVVIMGSPGRNFDDAKKIEEVVETENSSKEGLHCAITMVPQEEQGKMGPYDWPYRRSIAFAQACDLVIGPDTGLMWGVAMEMIPKIMLLSHASPENITKHWRNTTTLHADPERVSCWPCHQLHDDMSTCRPGKFKNAAACMDDIGVETIVQTVALILGV